MTSSHIYADSFICVTHQ